MSDIMGLYGWLAELLVHNICHICATPADHNINDGYASVWSVAQVDSVTLLQLGWSLVQIPY
jgi:hypothetical protein